MFGKQQVYRLAGYLATAKLKVLLSLLQGYNPTEEEAVLQERYPSAIPFLPPLSASTVKYYYQFYAFAVGLIILFGGLLSPALEVNLGLGGMLTCCCTYLVKSSTCCVSCLQSCLLAEYLSIYCRCELLDLSAETCELWSAS